MDHWIFKCHNTQSDTIQCKIESITFLSSFFHLFLITFEWNEGQYSNPDFYNRVLSFSLEN